MSSDLAFRVVLIGIAAVAIFGILLHYNNTVRAEGARELSGFHGFRDAFEGAGGREPFAGQDPHDQALSDQYRSDYLSPLVPPVRPEPPEASLSATEERVDELQAVAPVAAGGAGYGGEVQPSDLLPRLSPEAQQFAQLYPCGQGDLSSLNFLESGTMIGMSTNLKRNANMQLRSDPPIPYRNVSPWQMSTIRQDCHQRSFELGQA